MSRLRCLIGLACPIGTVSGLVASHVLTEFWLSTREIMRHYKGESDERPLTTARNPDNPAPFGEC